MPPPNLALPPNVLVKAAVCSIKTYNQLYQGRSLAFKIRRKAFPAGAPPQTPLGNTLSIPHRTRRFLILDSRAFDAPSAPRFRGRGTLPPNIFSRTAPDYYYYWWSGVVVSALASINEVNQRRARLVLRWVIVSGFNSR